MFPGIAINIGAFYLTIWMKAEMFLFKVVDWFSSSILCDGFGFGAWSWFWFIFFSSRAFQAYKLLWVCSEIGEYGKERAVGTDHITRNVPRSCWWLTNSVWWLIILVLTSGTHGVGFSLAQTWEIFYFHFAGSVFWSSCWSLRGGFFLKKKEHSFRSLQPHTTKVGLAPEQSSESRLWDIWV